MNQPHPHAAAMADYAKDAAEIDKPWVRWERRDPNVSPVWGPLYDHPQWLCQNEYRRKRAMVLVNGVEVPAPETYPPVRGAIYWLAEPCSDLVMALDVEWQGSEWDFKWLNLGIVYLNEADAIARAKAMLITNPAP